MVTANRREIDVGVGLVSGSLGPIDVPCRQTLRELEYLGDVTTLAWRAVGALLAVCRRLRTGDSAGTSARRTGPPAGSRQPDLPGPTHNRYDNVVPPHYTT
jgi:hypothetical protein